MRRSTIHVGRNGVGRYKPRIIQSQLLQHRLSAKVDVESLELELGACNAEELANCSMALLIKVVRCTNRYGIT